MRQSIDVCFYLWGRIKAYWLKYSTGGNCQRGTKMHNIWKEHGTNFKRLIARKNMEPILFYYQQASQLKILDSFVTLFYFHVIFYTMTWSHEF